MFVKSRHGMSQERLTEMYRSTAENMAYGYTKKNTDYDDAFNLAWDAFGFVAYKQRVFEKLLRIFAVSENGTEVGESLEDSVYDIASYSIMALMRLRNPQLFKDGEFEHAKKDDAGKDIRASAEEIGNGIRSAFKKVYGEDGWQIEQREEKGERGIEG